jgi:hypothetical protein
MNPIVSLPDPLADAHSDAGVPVAGTDVPRVKQRRCCQTPPTEALSKSDNLGHALVAKQHDCSQQSRGSGTLNIYSVPAQGRDARCCRLPSSPRQSPDVQQRSVESDRVRAADVSAAGRVGGEGGGVWRAAAPSPERCLLPARETRQRPQLARICRLGVAGLRDGISCAGCCTCFTESAPGDPDAFCGCSRRSASPTS